MQAQFVPLQTLDAPTRLGGGTLSNLSATLQNMEQEIGPDIIERVVEYPIAGTAGKGKNQNAIKTYKYTILTFLPLNLFGQFKRFYNLYFLLAALSTLAGNSSLSPVTSVLPLVAVLTVTAIKDAYEDYRRHKADEKANKAPVTILENGAEISVPTMAIQPGVVCKISKGQVFPADLVVIQSSSPDGVLYIETSDLDGETNLKRRKSVPSTQNSADTMQGKLELSNPSRNLYEFEARVQPAVGKAVSLGVNQFLPRGATLRNTDWIYGAAAYTGADTKVMLNLKNTGLKHSTLEGRLNALILAMFVFNIAVLAVTVIMAINGYATDGATDYWYLYDPADTTDPFRPGASLNYAQLVWDEILTWFAIYSYLIPISLFVSLELARLVQIIWISHDLSMTGYRKPPVAASTTALGRDAWTQLTMRKEKTQAILNLPVGVQDADDVPGEVLRTGWEPISPDHHPPDYVADVWTKVPAQVNNSNLNEDLGVVEYIFSDKTGTLTKNEMVLARWWIPGREFIEDADPGRLGKVIARQADPVMVSRAELFAKALLCCHDVLPTLSDDASQGLVYESQSPDDIAIVSGLRKDGLQLIGRSGDAIVVDWFGEQRKWEPLATLAFNSDRKRMSVIARVDGVIYLFIKGADNKIMERLAPENDPALIKEANDIVQRFAEVGLRTLLVAYRTLTEEDWQQWKNLYDETERQLKDREAKMGKVMEIVETELTLVGATGVEDKLQDDVAATIAYLLDCDIKLWVLTGDKVETAINIGMSASVLNQNQNIMVIREDEPAAIEASFDRFAQEIKAKGQWGSNHVRPEDYSASNQPFSWEYVKSGGWLKQFGHWLNWLMPLNASPRSGWGDAPEVEESWRNNAMVVTGDVLNALFECWGNDSCGHMTRLQIKFLELGTRCKSVICCRVSPLQKAQIVLLVRRYLHKVTLAIGDGANDVSMIQAANVGVGISGKEGAQAVRAADYSFMEFRALRPLVAVHGRWNFLRMTQIIYYSFYKNIAMIMVQFIYAFYSMQSGSMVYNDSFLLFYNVFFTAVPPLILSFFERDVARTPIYRYPELYRESRVRLWNLRTWAAWLLASLYVAVVAFYIPYLGFNGSEDILDGNGRGIGYETMVFYFSAYILIVVMVKLAMTFKGWTHPHWASIVLSFLILIVLEAWAMRPGQPSLTFGEMNANPAFWFLGLLTLGVCLLPDWAVLSFQKLLYPADVDIINEEWNETCKRDKYYVPEGLVSLPVWSDSFASTNRPEVENVGTLSVIPPEPIVTRPL